MQRGDVVMYVSQQGKRYGAMVTDVSDDGEINIVYAGTTTERGVPEYEEGMTGHYYTAYDSAPVEETVEATEPEGKKAADPAAAVEPEDEPTVESKAVEDGNDA